MFLWGSFLLYVFVTAVTPGPNNLMSMSNAGRLGLKRALPFNAGIWAGFSIVMILCALLCSLLEAVLPSVQNAMRVIGAAYMLYLAWKTFKGGSVASEETSARGFAAGFALQFMNPKIIVYGVVSMEAYILPVYAGQPMALCGFALLLAAIGAGCTVLWAGFGSLFRKLFARYGRTTNAVMALLLVYCAVSLFL